MNRQRFSVISTYILQILLLAASLALRFTPLTVFLLLILFLRVYLHFRPESRTAKALGKWVGPFPKANELLSSFQIRTGTFSITIGIGLGLLSYCGLMILQRYHELDSNMIYMAFFVFILPLLTLVFIVYGLGKIGKGFFIRFLGKEGQFVESEQSEDK